MEVTCRRAWHRSSLTFDLSVALPLSSPQQLSRKFTHHHIHRTQFGGYVAVRSVVSNVFADDARGVLGARVDTPFSRSTLYM
jgi:hypothetical protein